MFQLVTLTGGAPIPVLAADGKPFVFEHGREAAEAARKLTQERGLKVQPRPMGDDGSWRVREAARFADGTYKPVPWAAEPWFAGSTAAADHYVHVSLDKPGMVAFTEDAAKGAADRQTRVKAGVYLTRYFSDALTAEEIKRIATTFTAEREDNTVLFADTADEIERVYVNGPHSCMSADADEYSSSMHPVRVYAAGDLAVAYLERNESITARALVWPAKKIWGRVYGDETRLVRLLEGMGYCSGELDGARLLRVPERSGFVCPYIDYAHAVDDRGDFLIIDENGDIGADGTNGFTSGGAGQYCESCEDYADEDGFQTVRRLNAWGNVRFVDMCGCCADNNSFVCDATDERWDDQHRVEMADGSVWSSRHFDDHGFECDATGENYPTTERVGMANGEVWCRDHFDEHGFTCPDCGENFAKDDGEEIDGGLYCSDCAEARRSGEPRTSPPPEINRRPRVGDRVKIVDVPRPFNAGHVGEVGVVIRDDASSIPFEVRLAPGVMSMWFTADQVRLVATS